MSTRPHTAVYKAEDHHLIMHRTWCVVKVTVPFTALPPLVRGPFRERVLVSPSSRCIQVFAWERAVVYQFFLAGEKKKVRRLPSPLPTGTDSQYHSISTSSSRPCMHNETLVVRKAPRFGVDGHRTDWMPNGQVGDTWDRPQCGSTKNLVLPRLGQ